VTEIVSKRYFKYSILREMADEKKMNREILVRVADVCDSSKSSHFTRDISSFYQIPPGKYDEVRDKLYDHLKQEIPRYIEKNWGYPNQGVSIESTLKIEVKIAGRTRTLEKKFQSYSKVSERIYRAKLQLIDSILLEGSVKSSEEVPIQPNIVDVMIEWNEKDFRLRNTTFGDVKTVTTKRSYYYPPHNEVKILNQIIGELEILL
jgi:hypothetical protein